MKQNLYDDPEFFAGYTAMREAGSGLNEGLEQPAIKALLPDIAGKRVLDLGCGTGDLCRLLVAMGARHVVGVDISSKMLSIAREKCSSDIELCESAIEDFEAPSGSYDLVVSSLAFHYVADLNCLFVQVAKLLNDWGDLVFSIEHPIATSSQGIQPGWLRDNTGQKVSWQVDEYSNEGMRCSKWFVDGVVKYHRRLSTILNGLVDAGFQIQKVLEPHATPEAEQSRPSLLEERMRPPFLLVKAMKTGKTTETGTGNAG